MSSTEEDQKQSWYINDLKKGERKARLQSNRFQMTFSSIMTSRINILLIFFNEEPLNHKTR